ncbi:MAG: alkaline phosphatase family protein [Acidobacteriota bacterium]
MNSMRRPVVLFATISLTLALLFPQAAQRERFAQMFARAYFPGRSGQIFIVPRRNDMIVRLTEELQYMHGSPWEYDVHIPLLFYGPAFIRKGVATAPALLQDVAPTLARLLGVHRDSDGRALGHILRPRRGVPRVIAIVMVDAGRYDYFDRFAQQLPAFSRLRRDGMWFTECRLNYAPTVTAVAHSVVGSGYDPWRTGIVVNSVYSNSAARYEPIWPNHSPVNLQTLALADQWNLQTEGKSIIVAQGGAFYAAGSMVGHGGCLHNAKKVIAYGYGDASGVWESHPSCYVIPDAVQTMNARDYWERTGGKWMGHDVASPRKFRPSALFGEFESDALLKVLEQESIGQDEVTDLVLVNFKALDYVGHKFGPDAPEIAASMPVLNQFFERLTAVLEKKAGADGFVLAVSADHGMPPAPEPLGHLRVREADVLKAVRDKFDTNNNGKELFLAFQDSNLQIVVDREELGRLGLTLKEIAAYLETLDFVGYAYTEEEIREALGRVIAGRP